MPKRTFTNDTETFADIPETNPSDKVNEYKKKLRSYTLNKTKEETSELDNSARIIDWSTWVAASKVRNYMLNDPLLDWLAYYGKKKYTESNIEMPYMEHFHTFLMNKGIEFEKEVMNLLYKNYGSNIVTIADITQARSVEKYNETLMHIKKGTPIIYQGVLHNHDNNTYGMPDLIVRDDWLNKLVHSNIALTSKKPHILMSHGHYYVIVDIKHTTLHLTSNGINILNRGSTPAFKAQLCIYNNALSNIQGYLSPYAFILGRKWKYISCKKEYSGNSCFDTLGIIDYNVFDKQYITRTKEAINWLKRLAVHGGTWSLSPPSVKELYPNMCNYMNGEFGKLKDEIANELNEITMLWNCGVKQREYAHSMGIYKYKDPRCTPETLGFNKSNKCYNILKNIIYVNKENGPIFSPDRIVNNMYNWQRMREGEFYVDFEFISDIGYDMSKLPCAVKTDNVFLIGVGHIKNNKWIYTKFVADIISDSEEYRIFNEFMRYIAYEGGEGTPILYNWGVAEKSKYMSRINKFKMMNYRLVEFNPIWCNFIDVMKGEPITIKGALNYGLKSIGRAMHRNGMIETIWPENSICKNGLDAMVAAWNCSMDAKNRGLKMSQMPIMDEICKYNEIDCKMVYEIIKYMRTKK
jgi:hypothetical protein